MNISTFSKLRIIGFVLIVGKSLLLKEGSIREANAIKRRDENVKLSQELNDSVKGNSNLVTF